MIKIGDYGIKRYQYGYELHSPYEGFTNIDGKQVKTTKYRLTYWPSFKSACTALLDVETGKSEALADIVTRMDNCTAKIVEAITMANDK